MTLDVCPLFGEAATEWAWSCSWFVSLCKTLPNHSIALTPHQPLILSDRSKILGDFSEFNTREYTGYVP